MVLRCFEQLRRARAFENSRESWALEILKAVFRVIVLYTDQCRCLPCNKLVVRCQITNLVLFRYIYF